MRIKEKLSTTHAHTQTETYYKYQYHTFSPTLKNPMDILQSLECAP